MPQQNMNPDHNIPGEKLVYERAAGIVYARYMNPELSHIKRWIIGGDPAGFITGTGMPRPSDWPNVEDTNPDYTLMQQHPELQDKYKEFLELQVKYQAWETVIGR